MRENSGELYWHGCVQGVLLYDVKAKGGCTACPFLSALFDCAVQNTTGHAVRFSASVEHLLPLHDLLACAAVSISHGLPFIAAGHCCFMRVCYQLCASFISLHIASTMPAVKEFPNRSASFMIDAVLGSSLCHVSMMLQTYAVRLP